MREGEIKMGDVDVTPVAERGELSAGQDAGSERAARKKGPTREIIRGWFLLWLPDYRPYFDRKAPVLPNRRSD